MGKALQSEDIACYRRDGFFAPVRVLSEREVAEYLSNFEQLEASLGPGPEPVRLAHLTCRWAYDLATHSSVVDVAEDLLGPEILVHSTIIFYKTAGSPVYVSWHQDGLYPGLRVRTLTSAWIALTNSRVENGCLRVLPKSHRYGVLPHTERKARDNLLNRGQTISDVDENKAIDVELRAGEMSLHDVNLIHGSRPSRSSTKRVGFVVRFATPEMRSPNHAVVRLRGNADCAHLDLLTSPPSSNSTPPA